jgi:hypothetical protein
MVVATQELTELLGHQALVNDATAAGLSLVGAEKDVRTNFSCTVHVYHALVEALANDPALEYHFQVRYSTGTGVDEDWITAWRFVTKTDAAILRDLTATEPADETVIAVSSDPTAIFLPGDYIYIEDTTTLLDSEWARVAIASAAPDVTLVDGLAVEKDSADDMWTGAEHFIGEFDLTGVSWVRMIVVGKDTGGADIHLKSEMIALTAVA